MTLNEIAYNILNIVRGGRSNSDDHLSLGQIKFNIKYYRAMMIRRDLARNNFMSRHIEQDLGCLKLIRVNASKCCDFDIDCEVYRTEKKIPRTVRANFKDMITYVGGVDGVNTIPIIQPDYVKFIPYDKYTKNQRTPFVDEMTGDQRLEHIIFRNGALFVEKEKTTLQKLLDLHPFKDKIFYEHNAVEEAANEIELLEMEADAILMARQIDVDLAEAIMRVEIGSKVSEMSSKELKRDLLVFARNNPALFLELAADDNVQLRNFGIKAVELGIIDLSDDQRNFLWSSNKRKIMTVPFDEHPYTALAHWFKTDEGMEIYANIEKRLNS